MRRAFIFAAVLFSIICNSVSGQDIHFSQYNLTPLIVNPAQTGAYRQLQAIINYKSQWTSIDPEAFKTTMLSCDGRLFQKKMRNKWLAAGMALYSDKAGEAGLKTMQANVSLGYHIQLGAKNILGASLSGGFSQRSVDYTKFKWEEQYIGGAHDPNASTGETLGENKYGYPDAGFGILYQFNKGQFYSSANDMILIRAGLAVSHLNKPDYSFFSSGEVLYAKITGHVDAMIGIKKTHFALMPGFMYMTQGPATEMFPGCYFRYTVNDPGKSTGKNTAIMIGAHLRVKDAFIPSLQFEIGEYTIGLSYDLNVSGFKTATSGKGGMEISLRYGKKPMNVKSVASFN